ISSGVFSLPMS
ncbi:hypothetical protein D049_3909B, partial [Vibrio parahaemolyticus VPTS-2010]